MNGAAGSGRQASEKPQGRKPRARVSAAVRLALWGFEGRDYGVAERAKRSAGAGDGCWTCDSTKSAGAGGSERCRLQALPEFVASAVVADREGAASVSV